MIFTIKVFLLVKLWELGGNLFNQNKWYVGRSAKTDQVSSFDTFQMFNL